jgi:site-specific DNA-methyltransferase (adenine-specific)
MIDVSAASRNYPTVAVGRSLLVHADCFQWLADAPEDSIHAVVTDPLYGVKEYAAEQIEKRNARRGGIWRIPPAFDGHERAPLPRFTALSEMGRTDLQAFFTTWARLVMRVLRPGGHVMIASNTFLSQLTFSALAEGGLEFRGEIIRLVQTLRGGDRPKGAEKEFPGVCSMPRGGYEPWGLFRKPLPSGMRVAGCLRTFGTGALRRLPDGRPFGDVIPSERTPGRERTIAGHPSLKPQSFLRRFVHAALPLGEGVILDPFMGGGSTIAACEALGIRGIGVEQREPFLLMSAAAIGRLAALRFPSELFPGQPAFASKLEEKAGRLSLLGGSVAWL